MRKTIYIPVLLFAVVAVPAFAGQTWHLSTGQKWTQVQPAQDNFLLDVANAKKLVAAGKVGKARKKFKELKNHYPALAGADYDAFVNAELLYAGRKYEAASIAYSSLMNNYPNSRFYQAALERQNAIATAYLNGQKRTILGIFHLSAYGEGSQIMHEIADRAGDAPPARRALVSLARYTEKRGAYEDAFQVWQEVSNNWPTGMIGEEALYGMARTLKEAYEGPYFDSTVLESSETYYRKFQVRYPEKAKKIKVQKNINQIEKLLSEKRLEIAKYYERTDSFTAANLYYQSVIDEWPGSHAAKEAKKGIAAVNEKAKKPIKKSFWW